MRKSVLGISFLVFAIGLMMIISPDAWVKVTVIILGIFSVGNGLYNVISIRPRIADENYKKIIATRGIVSILVGLAAISLPLILAGVIWTVMIYVLATYLLLAAASEIISISHLKSVGVSGKTIKIEIIASIAIAIVLFIMPGEIAIIFIRVIGIALLIVSISLAIWEWKNRSTKIEVEEVI